MLKFELPVQKPERVYSSDDLLNFKLDLSDPEKYFCQDNILNMHHFICKTTHLNGCTLKIKHLDLLIDTFKTHFNELTASVSKWMIRATGPGQILLSLCHVANLIQEQLD